MNLVDFFINNDYTKKITWIQNNIYINSESPLILNPNQKTILRDESKHRIFMLERQTGKTVAILSEAIYESKKRKNNRAVIYTRPSSNSNIIRRMLQNTLIASDIEVKIIKTNSRNEIQFQNGSIIKIMPFNNRIVRGEYYDIAYFDSVFDLNFCLTSDVLNEIKIITKKFLILNDDL